MQEFEAYYEAQKPWLEPRTRNAIDGIKKLISDNYIDLMRASASTKLPDTPSDENEAAARVYTWVGGGGMYLHQEFPPGTLPKLLEAFDAEVDKVLGNRPWWQRVVRR